MKFGISITAILEQMKPSPTSILKYKLTNSFDHLIYKSIEKLVHFSEDNDLKYIELATEAPFYNISPEIIDKIKEYQESNDIEFLLHAPFIEANLGSLDEKIRKISCDRIKDTIKTAAEIGIKKITTHPTRPRYALHSPLIFRSQIVKNVISSLDDCSSVAEKYNCQLLVENIVKDDQIFNNPKDMLKIRNDKVGFTLDTAHSLSNSIDPANFLEKLGKRIGNIHLCDSKLGEKVEELALGNGDLDYKKFFKKIKKIGYKGPIILEMTSFRDVKNSLDLVRSIPD